MTIRPLNHFSRNVLQSEMETNMLSLGVTTSYLKYYLRVRKMEMKWCYYTRIVNFYYIKFPFTYNLPFLDITLYV